VSTADLARGRRWSERLYIEVPRTEIAYLKFILEAYDNLAFFTVVDRYRAVLQVVYAIDQEQQLQELLGGLALEIPVKRVLRSGDCRKSMPGHVERHCAGGSDQPAM
jgi:hypothetical protein